MRFKNRDDAARQLVERLIAYKGQNPLVLGVPRGAVPMARIIADALGGEQCACLRQLTSTRSASFSRTSRK